MMFPVAYYFAAFATLYAHNMVFPVGGQPTVQDCQSNGVVAEQNLEAIRYFNEQVQSLRQLLIESTQQMKAQHDSAMTRLDVAIQLLLYHDVSTKNQTGNPKKLAIGVPVPLENGIDLKDGFVLLPSVNNWVILMKRFDGSLDFHRNWTEYRNGFGDIGRGEFWLGNEIVHRLTNRGGVVYALRIEGQVASSERWFSAEYSTFSLDSEVNKYTLRLSGFSGHDGDSLTNSSLGSKSYHGGMRFSTWNNNNDGSDSREYNCAQRYRAGWWFNYCSTCCLTCPYDGENFLWSNSNGYQSCGKLRSVRMMIKSA